MNTVGINCSKTTRFTMVTVIVQSGVYVLSVRDAAARLPNGEGTRSDICELLKDSQFLAPGVTDVQV